MQSVESKAQPQRLPHPVRITEQVWPEGTVPVVSIWCITYNHVNFIRDAIEGFLMQETTFPVEIFIHDDASTDGTAEVIKEYAGKYPQLFWTVFQTENQWSKGNKKILFDYLAQQRGEFIALCEGDDYWTSPHKLQKQWALLEAHPASFMVGGFSLTLRDGLAEKSNQDFLVGPLQTKASYSLKDLFHQGFHTSTYFLRVAIAEELETFARGGAFTNADTVIQMLAAAKGDVLFLDEVVSRYRLHAGGVWTGAIPHRKVDDAQKTVKLFDNYLGGKYSHELSTAAMDLAETISKELMADRRLGAAFAVYGVTLKNLFPRSLGRLLAWPLLLPLYRWPNLMNKLTMKLALRSRVRQLGNSLKRVGVTR